MTDIVLAAIWVAGATTTAGVLWRAHHAERHTAPPMDVYAATIAVCGAVVAWPVILPVLLLARRRTR